jgi:hypothetical protein
VAFGRSPSVGSNIWLGEMAGDRSWVRRSSGFVDQALVATWHQEAEAKHGEALVELIDGGEVRRSQSLLPGISVVITSYQERSHIEQCMRSLAQQTLAGQLFEVIVVLNGRPSGTVEVIDRFRQAQPSVTLRVIQLNLIGASRARNAGIAAASRKYTTFIDADDYVSQSFLEVLLANAGPRVVPIAAVIDVGPNRHHQANHVNRMLADHASELPIPTDIEAATATNAAKAVATDLIKDALFDVDLASGGDVLFWMNVVVRGRAQIRPCPPSDGATYYRVVRQDSVPASDLTFESGVTQPLEVISRLESLAEETDANALELLRGPIGAQTAAISDYLQQNPGDRERVVKALDRSPVFHLPYGRMNATLARGLAIAFAFPPYADTSAIVTAKRIRANGKVVDVIYNAMDAIRDIDDKARRIAGPFVGHEVALPTPSYFADWGSMERFSNEGLKVIRRWEAAKGPYDWLYSRAHFAASHLLAAVYKLSRPTATWSAEFSDPLSRDIFGQERGRRIEASSFLDGLRKDMKNVGMPVPHSVNSFVWCEEVTYALADELIFTNENQMEYMLGYCSNPEVATIARKKAVIAPHPTLPREFYSMVNHNYRFEADLIHLAYFGNFYATRGLDDVLAAVAGSDSWTRARLRVHVFTTKQAELERRAVELGVSDAVQVRPYVGYLEFLNLTTKFDCLIVNDAVTGHRHAGNPYLPSKWADYRGSGTPVWGLVEAASPLSRQPLEFASPIGDVDAACDVLSRIARTRRP